MLKGGEESPPFFANLAEVADKMEKITLQNIEKIFEGRPVGAVGRHKNFSVLVPLVETEDGLCLLYEVRAEKLKQQPGEICFPGGRVEGAETYKDCALRETVEELGVCYDDIRVINQLDTLYAYSNFNMYCFLGVLDAAVVERVISEELYNKEEVKEIFLLPLSFLLENEPLVYESDVVQVIPEDFPYDLINFPNGYKWRHGSNEIPIYKYKDYILWGLTARISRTLAKILLDER